VDGTLISGKLHGEGGGIGCEVQLPSAQTLLTLKGQSCHRVKNGTQSINSAIMGEQNDAKHGKKIIKTV